MTPTSNASAIARLRISITEMNCQLSDYWQVEIIVRGDHTTLQHTCSIPRSFVDEAPSRADMQWYFSKWHQMPFLQAVRASKVGTALYDYGRKLFDILFPTQSTIRIAYEKSIMANPENLYVEVIGGERFHALQWETLCDSKDTSPLAIRGIFIRKVDARQTHPRTFSGSISSLNILLVVARPRGSVDIGYRTISRPIVDLIERYGSHCRLHIVRPGTFQALRTALDKMPIGFYQLVHLDLHGLTLDKKAYERQLMSGIVPSIRPVDFAGNEHQAFLLFRGEKGTTHRDNAASQDLVSASRLAIALEERGVRFVFLNACDSASATSSLVHRLFTAGLQFVMGMSFSLSEGAAVTIIQCLYETILGGGSFAAGVQNARRALWMSKDRLAYYGAAINVEDWILPVAYQDEDVKLTFPEIREVDTKDNEENISATPGIGKFNESHGKLTLVREEQQTDCPSTALTRYGNFSLQYFVGRDSDILEIEHLLLEGENILFIKGMGGIGKSSLFHHLGAWWKRTDFVEDIFYFEYETRRLSADDLVFLLGAQLFPRRGELSPKKLQKEVVNKLRKSHFLLILDNLETITYPYAGDEPWDRKDKLALWRFVAALQGGCSFVLLGSRSDAEWLSNATFDDNQITLSGLDEEAASFLVKDIFQRCGRTQYLDKEFINDIDATVKRLDRHPLAMQVIFANLGHATPTELLYSLESDSVQFDLPHDLLLCIEYSFERLPAAVQSRLLDLAPFGSRIVWANLENYDRCLFEVRGCSQQVQDNEILEWNTLLKTLEQFGLATWSGGHRKLGFVRLHPTFPHFLRHKLGVGSPRMEELDQAFRQHVNAVAQLYVLPENSGKYPLLAPPSSEAFDFEYVNYVRCLDIQMSAIKESEQPNPLLIYRGLENHLQGSGDTRGALAICQRVLAHFDVQNAMEIATKPSNAFDLCAVVRHSCMHQQLLQDRDSAVRSMQLHARLLQALHMYFEEQLGVWKSLPGYIEQDASVREMIAVEKSMACSQLANLAMTFAEVDNAVMFSRLSLAWRRTTHEPIEDTRSAEQPVLEQLADELSLLDSSGVTSSRYARAAAMRAWDKHDMFNLIRIMITGCKTEALSESGMEAVEALHSLAEILAAHMPSQGLETLVDIDQQRAEIAARRLNDELALEHYRRAFVKVKQLKNTEQRERLLYVSLAQWRHSQNDFEGSKDYWTKALNVLSDTEDMAALVQLSATLDGLQKAEQELGNLLEAEHYRAESSRAHKSAQELQQTGGIECAEEWRDIVAQGKAELIELSDTLDECEKEVDCDAQRWSELFGNQ